MNKPGTHRDGRGQSSLRLDTYSRLSRMKLNGGQEYPRSLPFRCAPRTTFEQGTGFDPELLARRAVNEFRAFIRHPRFDHAMDTLIALVSTRAERVWATHPFWRKRWGRCRKNGDCRSLMLFFRHWTHAAAVREGVCQVDLSCVEASRHH